MMLVETRVLDGLTLSGYFDDLSGFAWKFITVSTKIKPLAVVALLKSLAAAFFFIEYGDTAVTLAVRSSPLYFMGIASPGPTTVS
jgi:hypothetical protein